MAAPPIRDWETREVEKAFRLDLHTREGTRKDGIGLEEECSEKSLCSGCRTEVQGMAGKGQLISLLNLRSCSSRINTSHSQTQTSLRRK
jgi:hypothetical protein